VYDVPDSSIRILGCTLWSHVPPQSEEAVAGGLTDYRAIKVSNDSTAASDGGESHVVTVSDTNKWHATELKWLKEALETAKTDCKRVVVMTHHAPSLHGTGAPAHSGSDIESGFGTSLEDLLCSPVVAWLFGHTHWSSWQGYDKAEGKWRPLAGGLDRPLDTSELHKSVCENGEVLVASNQLGYGAKGDHHSSRCHPGMYLEVPADGNWAKLRCAINVD